MRVIALSLIGMFEIANSDLSIKDLINIDILKEVLSNNENFKNLKIQKIFYLEV